MILRISEYFGSRGGATEILTMISVQTWEYLSISEDWAKVYACGSFKLIIYNNCLVYIHSLHFSLIISVTNVEQSHAS